MITLHLPRHELQAASAALEGDHNIWKLRQLVSFQNSIIVHPTMPSEAKENRKKDGESKALQPKLVVYGRHEMMLLVFGGIVVQDVSRSPSGPCEI